MQVKVENLYYLLCYAWDHLEARDLVSVDAVSTPSVEALLGRVLLSATQGLLRQKLDRGYREEVDELRRPRGKLEVARTVSRGLEQQGLVVCSFDEYTEDVLHNRIVKTTCRKLARVESLPRPLSSGLMRAALAMPQVRDISVQSSDFHRVQLHANLRRYRLALHVCALLHRCLLPHPSGGGVTFRSFTGDEREMGLLFEEFVRSFLRHEQRVFPNVGRSTVQWVTEGETHGLIPSMQTDVTLRRPGQTVVIETKCYGSTLVGGARGHRESVRSKDLYQLVAYLSNLSAREGRLPTGVLLYAVDHPQVPTTRVRLLGFDVLIEEIDLNRPWQQISGQLLGLVERVAKSAPSTHES
jgi:5-methylcytosine-specific restriction enzyme subunit McrC